MRYHRLVMVVFYDRGHHHYFRQYETARIRVRSSEDLTAILRMARTGIFGSAAAVFLDEDPDAEGLSKGKLIREINFFEFRRSPKVYVERLEKYLTNA